MNDMEVKEDRPIRVADRMTQFREALMAGIQGIVKAGQIYVETIDEHPESADAFRNEFADLVPASAWSKFEAVGRKQMHPQLLLGGVQSPKKTRAIKKLPYSTQERIMAHERFSMLTSTGDTLQVSILDASDEQAAQLCAGDHIRDLSEQRSYMESMRNSKKKESPAEPLPYTITGGRVRFRKDTVLSRSEVKRLLQEM